MENCSTRAYVRRGISVEKQIQKRDATFANTIGKFGSISFAVESVKEFQEGAFGPTLDCKNVIKKTLAQLKVLGVIFHNILLVMKHKSISYRKMVLNSGPLNTPNANMADHLVGARDESNDSEASQALMFCFDNAFPEKFCFVVDLVSLLRPPFPFLCS